MSIPAEDWPAAAALARTDFYFFARLMMLETKGVPWARAPHHEKICRALERVYRGECKRLIINIPPRYSKSELVKCFIAWTLGHVPDSEYITTSYTAELAAGNSWDIREVVASEPYRRVFPGVALDTRSMARNDWRTTAGGRVYAAGSEGSITGHGGGKMRPTWGGCIVIDDPHKVEEAHSDVTRPKVIDWYQRTLQSRANASGTPIIVIMQRLHEEDLAGWLLAGGTGEEWESVILPAIDPETGEALWPEKHTIETLRQMERMSPYTFAGQYLQRPAPPGGGLFKPDEMPVLEARPKLLAAVRAWDLAGSPDKGDHTAGVLLGLTGKDSYVICDARHFQGSPDAVEAAIVSTAKLDGRGVRVGLPVDPGQAGKAQILYLTRKLAGFTVASSPESGDKFTRAEPIAAQMNIGNVSIVRGDWNLEFINELRNFPNGKWDDQVDALSRAFMTLTARRGPMVISEELMAYAARKGI